MCELTPVQRVFSYSSRNDRLLLTAAVMASAGAGATLPLMNIIFGMDPTTCQLRPQRKRADTFTARLVKTFNVRATTSLSESPTPFMSVINEYV